jgi:hypothetical protein
MRGAGALFLGRAVVRILRPLLWRRQVKRSSLSSRVELLITFNLFISFSQSIPAISFNLGSFLNRARFLLKDFFVYLNTEI